MYARSVAKSFKLSNFPCVPTFRKYFTTKSSHVFQGKLKIKKQIYGFASELR